MITSKRQMFILIGSFILIVLLGTITYAFFNYTRTGIANRIQVGRIYFDSEQGNVINLTNVFPIDAREASSENDNVGSVTIHITGDTTYTEGIEYLVTAVDVNNTIGEGNNTKTIPISVAVDYEETESKSIGTEDSDYFENRGGNTSLYKLLNKRPIGNGSKLVVGYIKPDATGIDGTITINAFLDKDKIAISDTYPVGTHTETIGEDTYEVNPDMTVEELNACKGYFASEIGTIIVNPNPTADEINECASYFRDTGMDNYMQSGETIETFCDGTGTFQGMTLQQFVDNDYFTFQMIDNLLDINILIIQANDQVLEYFCNGNGEINGTTFQYRLDNGYFSSSQLTYLKNNHLINQLTYQITNSWTDGTTSSWVNGRTILTTDEWNSLQNTSLSFKIKVEANEGIWVPIQGNAMYNLPRFSVNSSLVKEVYFNDMDIDEMHQRYEAATIKTDLTYNNEGEVLAWLEPNANDNSKYTMYIASDGETFLMKGNSLFYNSSCTGAEKVEFNNVNTSRLTDMNDMFYGLTKVKELDLTSFDTSNVIDMSNLVYRCYDVKKVNLSGLDMRKVQDMTNMFYASSSLSEVDFTGVQTRDIVSMHGMFTGGNSIEYLNLDGLGGDNLNDVNYMFQVNPKFVSISMKNFNFGTARMDDLFSNLTKLESVDLTGANTSNVTSMYYMFDGANKIEFIDLSMLNTSKVTRMNGMFYNCTSLKKVILNGLGSNVLTNVNSMFQSNTSLEEVYMSNFNFGTASMDYLFSNNGALLKVDLSNANTTNVQSMADVFYFDNSLNEVNLTGINTSNVTNMRDMFYHCISLVTIDLSSFDTSSLVVENDNYGAAFMFYDCPALTTIYVSNTWDISNHPTGMPIFYNNGSLVGGNGTTYDSTKTDKNMAVIDTEETPGYLTLKTN